MRADVCPYGWSKNEQHVKCAVAAAIVDTMAMHVPEHLRDTVYGKMCRELLPLLDRATVSLRNPNMPKSSWQRIHRTLALASKLLGWSTDWPAQKQQDVWMMQVSVGELLWMNAVNLCPMWFRHPASVSISAVVVHSILRSMSDRLFEGLEEGPVDLAAWDAYLKIQKVLGRKL